MKFSAKLTILLLSLFLVIFCLVACDNVACDEAGKPGQDSSSAVSGYGDTETAGYRLDVKKYTIVRPEKATAVSTSAAAELKRQIDSITGSSISISDDWVRDTTAIPDDAFEILLGNTNRQESVNARAMLDGMKFSIILSGNRVVITAANDVLLSYAVKYFISEYLIPTAEAGVFSIPEGLSYLSEEYGSIDIVKASISKFHIVYPGSSNDAIKPEYQKLKDYIDRLTGTKGQTAGTDLLSKTGTYDSNAAEILLGDTLCPETKTAMSQLEADEYGIFVVGEKVVVCGRTRASSILAVEKFSEFLGASTVIEENGKVSICLVYETPMIFKNESYTIDIPEFTAVTLTGAYDCGDGALAMYYNGAKEADYNKYCSEAEAAGFTQLTSHTANDNIFKTYTNGETRLYVSFINSDENVVRITTERTSMTMPPINAAEYIKICTPSVTQLALSYTADNTNGMGYIIRLSDGSFLIYDGGFTKDSETIMDALNLLNFREGKPYIRMWLITHMHGDHYQAFRQFAVDFAKEITLEYLAVNVAHKYYDVDNLNVYTKGNIGADLAKFKGAKIIKVHAGSVLRFADAEIEILATHEELYPGILNLEYTNDTSIVSRLKIAGQTLLFLGDAQTLESNVLVAMYGDYLKSDFVQISHHGSYKHSATQELYEYITAEWAFFPGSQTRYIENAGSVVNTYLIKKSGIKQIFVADKADRTITLPFG